jgi:hypothetical protein
MATPEMKNQSSVALIYETSPTSESSIPQLTNVQIKKKLGSGNLRKLCHYSCSLKAALGMFSWDLGMALLLLSND